MNMKLLAIVTAILWNGGNVLAESVHLPQAIEHTKAAITHGEAGSHGGVEHTPLLVSNITTALEHAKASEKAEHNPHTVEAVTHLSAAVDAAGKGDVAGGTEHAKVALKHLDLAAEPAKK